VILDHAYVMAAGNHLDAAETTAREGLTQARNLGLFRLQLEASLALGKIQLKEEKTNSDAGRKRLVETEKTAHAKGFELIAGEANAALRHSPPSRQEID